MENTTVVEEWKQAVSSRFPDLVTDLEISNLGNIRKKHTGHIFKTKDHKEGYPCIKRKAKTIYRHTLVAETFLGPRADGYVIDHIDNNKFNNTLANLRYVTQAYNSAKNDKVEVAPGEFKLARHWKENTIRGMANLKDDMKKMSEKVDMLEKRLYEANAVILALVTQVAGPDAVPQVQQC